MGNNYWMAARNLLLVLLGVVCFFILVVLGVSKVDESPQNDYKKRRETGVYMPEDATDIVEVGNGWQEFTYKGQRFLFYRESTGHNGFSSIVKIDPK